MKKINLEEILDKHIGIDTMLDLKKQLVLNSMKEACLQTLKLASEEAEADYNMLGDNDTGSTIEVYVLKNSILDLKDRIK